jgi:hypothetical protein
MLIDAILWLQLLAPRPDHAQLQLPGCFAVNSGGGLGDQDLVRAMRLGYRL